jgi:DNA invertase Pin-like site-specific DNA recombinase
MTANDALERMGLLTRPTDLKGELRSVTQEQRQQVLALASQGIRYSRIGFQMNLHYETILKICGPGRRNKKRITSNHSNSSITQ